MPTSTGAYRKFGQNHLATPIVNIDKEQLRNHLANFFFPKDCCTTHAFVPEGKCWNWRVISCISSNNNLGVPLICKRRSLQATATIGTTAYARIKLVKILKGDFCIPRQRWSMDRLLASYTPKRSNAPYSLLSIQNICVSDNDERNRQENWLLAWYFDEEGPWLDDQIPLSKRDWKALWPRNTVSLKNTLVRAGYQKQALPWRNRSAPSRKHHWRSSKECPSFKQHDYDSRTFYSTGFFNVFNA